MLFSHYGEIGKHDGSFVRWETFNPREFLWKLRDKNPEADDNELLEIWRKAMLAEQNSEYLLSVIDYFFVNASRTWREQKGETPAAAEVEVQRVAQKQAQQKRVVEAKEEILVNAKTLVLMDLLLPHGKTLCDSTGGECATLAPRMGKWLEKIAKAVPVGKLVGKTLTEQKLRELYASV